MKPVWVKLLSGFIALIGLGWFLIAFFSFRSTLSLVQNGKVATATIQDIDLDVSYRRGTSSDDEKHHRIRKKKSYVASLEFIDENGSLQTFEQDITKYKNDLKSGSVVEVLYEFKPELHARLRESVSIPRELIPALIGAIFLVLAWVVAKYAG